MLTEAQMRALKKYRAKPEAKAIHNSYSKEWEKNKYNTDPEFKLKKLAYAKAYRESKKLTQTISA